MSSDQLQQAIALIKSGDKQGGQALLAEILNSDPKNEAAWLWLASVVPAERRVFCLEKALSINPDNVQVRQHLEQLRSAGQVQPGPAAPSPAADEPVQPGPAAPAPTASAQVEANPAAPSATEKVVLKPNASKILLSWLTMSLVVGGLVILTNLGKLSNLIVLLIVIVVVLFQAFIFNIIFYNLPYFKVEVDGATLSGPRSWGMGWARTKIPIADVDLAKINSTFAFFGLYMIRSHNGEKVSLWGFDEKQFKRLVELLGSRKGIGQ